MQQENIRCIPVRSGWVRLTHWLKTPFEGSTPPVYVSVDSIKRNNP